MVESVPLDRVAARCLDQLPSALPEMPASFRSPVRAPDVFSAMSMATKAQQPDIFSVKSSTTNRSMNKKLVSGFHVVILFCIIFVYSIHL